MTVFTKGQNTNNYDKVMYGLNNTLDIQNDIFARSLGRKSYELKDHLGNVRVTFSDIKMPKVPFNGTYEVDLLSKSEYFPYGMQIEELGWNAVGRSARYGYNGKENDNEVKGENNSLDFGARIYDPRGARFLSQDPLRSQFAFQSPFIFAGDSPINSVDENGEYKKTVNYTLNKDGSHNVLKVSTDNSLKYWSIVSFGILPVIPNTVEYVLWDDKGNKISTSGDLPLENIGSTRYPGPFNPRDLSPNNPDYRYPPINSLDLAGMNHDKAYDDNKEKGADGAFMSIKPGIIEADMKLVMASMDIVYKYLVRQKDPVSKTKIGLEQAGAALAVAALFSGIVKEKMERVNNPHLQKMALEMQSMMNGLSQLPSDLKEVAEESLNKMENELTPNP